MPKLSLKMKELVAENMRSAIIEACRKIILRDGFESLTMEKLAQEAEVSTGSIYNYFENKEAVVGGIMESAFQNMLATVKKTAAAKRPPEDRILAIVKFMLDDFHDMRCLHEAIMHVRPRPSRNEFSQKHRMLVENIGQVISDGMESGCFKNSVPLLAASALLGMIREFQIDPGMIFKDVPSEELARNITDIFLSGIKKTAENSHEC